MYPATSGLVVAVLAVFTPLSSPSSSLFLLWSSIVLSHEKKVAKFEVLELEGGWRKALACCITWRTSQSVQLRWKEVKGNVNSRGYRLLLPSPGEPRSTALICTTNAEANSLARLPSSSFITVSTNGSYFTTLALLKANC